MAKPILIIKVPVTISEEDAGKQKADIQEKLKDDYHVLVSRCLAPGAEIKFECVGFQHQ